MGVIQVKDERSRDDDGEKDGGSGGGGKMG